MVWHGAAPPRARSVTCQQENGARDDTEGDKRLEVNAGIFPASTLQAPLQFLPSPGVLCKVTRAWVTSRKSGQDCHAAGCCYVILLWKYGPIRGTSNSCLFEPCRPEGSGNDFHLMRLQTGPARDLLKGQLEASRDAAGHLK